MNQKTFQEVIDQDGGKPAGLLGKIKTAYEEFLENMLASDDEGQLSSKRLATEQTTLRQ